MKNNKEEMITVKVFKCPYCNDKVYAAYRNDFQSCECGLFSIDGYSNDNLFVLSKIDPKIKRKLKIRTMKMSKKEYLEKIKKQKENELKRNNDEK